MRFTCQGCSWRYSGTNAAWAHGHESSTGHRVVLWDTPTSQMPRSFWEPKVAK